MVPPDWTTPERVANKPGMISRELYELMAKKHSCSFDGTLCIDWQLGNQEENQVDSEGVLCPTRAL
jgi:hypothetical protein